MHHGHFVLKWPLGEDIRYFIQTMRSMQHYILVSNLYTERHITIIVFLNEYVTTN